MQTVGVWGMDIESKAFQYPLKRLANDSIFLPQIESNTIRRRTALMAKKVCYCFGYTDSDIEQDILTHGQSLIMDKIMESKKAGRCQCADKNPKGR